MIVSLAARTRVSTFAVSLCSESVSSESNVRVSAGRESVAVLSAAVVSMLTAVVSGVTRVSTSESASLLRPTALPASMPNDCAAATITSSAGTHILDTNFFITRRQRYE